MAMAWTGPRWHSILTSGVDMDGDHSVTVPEEGGPVEEDEGG